MMELIRKADALHAVLHNTGDAAVAAVQEIKAVDAVPVVRCGECKYWEAFKNGVNGWCIRHGVPEGSLWYCADGERKDGEG